MLRVSLMALVRHRSLHLCSCEEEDVEMAEDALQLLTSIAGSLHSCVGATLWRACVCGNADN